MSDQQLEKIERAIDRPVANALTVNRNAAGGTFTVAPQNMGELLEFAKLMAVSSFCVRPAFRGNPGACLAVALQAFRCGGDPFAWANKAYITKNKAGEEQISYEAQLVHAIVNSSSVLQRRLRPVFEGEGQGRFCRIVGFVKGETEALDYESPPISKIAVTNSPLWTADPDQQLFYYSTRAWARRHVPEILLGIYAPEEFAETIDLTPLPEPQREDYMAVGKPAPIDDRPEIAVVDFDGTEHIFHSGERARDAIRQVLEEAARGTLEQLDGAWESNQPTIEQMARGGFADEAVELAQLYDHLRTQPASQAGEPTPADAGRPDADGGGPADDARGGAPPAPEDPKRRGDTAEDPHSGPQTHVAPAGANDAASGASAPHAPAPAAPAPIQADRPFPGDMPSNTASVLANADRGPAAADRDREITPPVRKGRPDYRTWCVALMGPKVRQQKTSTDLALLIGDNHEHLEAAKIALTGGDARLVGELDAVIAEQYRVIGNA